MIEELYSFMQGSCPSSPQGHSPSWLAGPVGGKYSVLLWLHSSITYSEDECVEQGSSHSATDRTREVNLGGLGQQRLMRGSRHVKSLEIGYCPNS